MTYLDLTPPPTSRQYLINIMNESRNAGATYYRYLSLRKALETFSQHRGGDCLRATEFLFARMSPVNEDTPELTLRQILCVLRMYARGAILGQKPFIGE